MKKLVLISFTFVLALFIVKDQTLNTAYNQLKQNVNGVNNKYHSTYSNVQTAVDDFSSQKDEKVEELNDTINRINRIRDFLVEVDDRYFEYDNESNQIKDVDCTQYLVKPDTRCTEFTEECGYYVDSENDTVDLYDYCPAEYLREAKEFFGLETSAK